MSARVMQSVGEVPVEEPDEFAESRPVDIDDCELCAGTGMYETRSALEPWGTVEISCPWCGGTGERGAA